MVINSITQMLQLHLTIPYIIQWSINIAIVAKGFLIIIIIDS